jgi:hypothetical protein
MNLYVQIIEVIDEHNAVQGITLLTIGLKITRNL